MKNGVKIGLLSDVISDMQRGVMNFTENGECSNCGACCSNLLPMTQYEVKRLRRFIRESGYKGHRSALALVDMTCPFRNNEKHICDIYNIRPTICRDFKCDKPVHGEWAHDELYAWSVRIVNVRHELFGDRI